MKIHFPKLWFIVSGYKTGEKVARSVVSNQDSFATPARSVSFHNSDILLPYVGKVTDEKVDGTFPFSRGVAFSGDYDVKLSYAANIWPVPKIVLVEDGRVFSVAAKSELETLLKSLPDADDETFTQAFQSCVSRMQNNPATYCPGVKAIPHLSGLAQKPYGKSYLGASVVQSRGRPDPITRRDTV
ncbi:MAG: hypothetical protein AABY01_03715 [Nanoarchaeota archaeon]